MIKQGHKFHPHHPHVGDRDVVLADHYDVLAVQYDEALAREAELRSEFASLHKCLERQRREALESLQQRLAEAEKLLRRLTAYGRVHFDLNDADVARVEACDFLASPGCADADTAEPPASEKYDDVLAPFLGHMRRELHVNAGKGDRPAWLQMTPGQCLLEIYYHVSKLQKAVRDNDPVRVAENTADVANMAMMMADIFGLLGESR